MNFQVMLQSLDDLLDADLSDGATFFLTYHVHTSWRHDDTIVSSVSECSHDDIGGSYDPTHKCGPTSDEATTMMCQENATDAAAAADYSSCSTKRPSECEAGDLSGKHGKLKVESDGTAQKWVVNDFYGLEIDHYVYENNMDNNSQQRSPVWSSIAFRYDDAQQVMEPILCCKIVVIES
jgi:hypothetical protein